MTNQRYFTVEGSTRTYDRNKLLTVLLFALMLALLQVSSVNNLLPSIQDGLSASDSDLQWVLSGYALAYGVILIPAGRFGDIFGRCGGFSTGIALFALTSLGCGLAPSSLLLNVMRIAQGFAAGVFSPQVAALIQSYYEGRDRAKAFGIMGLVISASVAIGPILSGVFVAVLGAEQGWRWSFLINLPLGLLLLGLSLLWLPFGKERRTMGQKRRQSAPKRPEAEDDAVASGQAKAAATGGHERPKVDLDPVGNILVVVLVLTIMLPFMTGYWWRWFLLLVAVALAGLWIAWEKAYKRRGGFPMVDLSLFSVHTYTYCTATTALQFLGSTSIFVIVALFLQQGLGYSALTTGLIGLPNTILSAYFALWSGKRSFDRGAQIQVLALVLALGGILVSIPAAYAVARGIHPILLAGTLTFVGVGLGMIGSANQTQAMLEIEPAKAGTAGAVQQTSQRITTAIGNAMITAVFFAAHGAGATPTDWSRGFSLGLGVIALALTAALVVALVYMRKYPHAGPDLAARRD